MLICNVGLLSGLEKEDRISIRQPQIPRPWNPIRASQVSWSIPITRSGASKALEDIGALDNTLFIYICGDNGTSAEGALSVCITR